MLLVEQEMKTHSQHALPPTERISSLSNLIRYTLRDETGNYPFRNGEHIRSHIGQNVFK